MTRFGVLLAGVAASLIGSSLAQAQDRGAPPAPVKREVPPAVDRNAPPAAPANRGAPAAPADRGAPPAAPADRGAVSIVTGKVVAYQADKSITLEVPGRDGQVNKVEFVISKDKTKIESRGGPFTIEVGMNVAVLADKDNPKLAAAIMPGGTGTR